MTLVVVAGEIDVSVSSTMSAQSQPANTLPEGKGRDIVGAACMKCHGGAAFSRLRQGNQAWRYEIYVYHRLCGQLGESFPRFRLPSIWV